MFTGFDVQRPSKMGNDLSILCISHDVGHAPKAHADASEADGAFTVQCALLLCGEHEKEWHLASGRVRRVGRVVPIHHAPDTNRS